MLETFTPVSSSYLIHTNVSYNDDICCPVPRRPSSPAVKYMKVKKLPREDIDWEASQELNEILYNQVSFSSVYAHESVEYEETRAVPYRSSASPFDATKSPVKNLTSNLVSVSDRQALVESSDSEDSNESGLKPLSELLTVPKFVPRYRKPTLGDSCSSLTFVPEQTELITPPRRSHNPLPMNSPFSSKKVNVELGLLSISPPPEEDEETLLRRHRVKFRRKTDRSRHPSRRKPNLHSDNAHNNVNSLPSAETDLFGCAFDVNF